MCRWFIVAIVAGSIVGACADDTPSPPLGPDAATGGNPPSKDGGEVDATSTDADVGSMPCIVDKTGKSGDDLTCSTYQLYRYGADFYGIDCHCPDATCTCRKNAALVGEVRLRHLPELRGSVRVGCTAVRVPRRGRRRGAAG